MEDWAAEDSFEDSQILYSEIRRCAGESTSRKEMESNAERDKEKSKNSVPGSNDAYSADEAEHETLKDRGLSGVELQDQPKALETRLKNAHIEDEAQNETSKDNGLSGVELQDQTSLDKSGNESGEETEDEHGKFVERASESKTVLEQATQVAAQPRGQVNSRPVAVKENELDLTSFQRMEVNRVTALISVDSAPSSPILLPKSSGAQHVVHDLKTTKAEAELQDGVEGQKIESKDREEEMPECQNVRASKKRRKHSMSRVNEQLDETQKEENREELQQ